MSNLRYIRGRQYNYDSSEFRPILDERGIGTGYFVRNDGEIFSSEARNNCYYPDSKNWKKLKWSISGRSEYPKVGLYINGCRTTKMVHILVANAWVCELPRPQNVSENEWNNLSVELKKFIRNAFVVNHIDHNKLNYHPSNLEFCTSAENSRKSVTFYSELEAA